MKTILTLFILLTSSLFIASCGGGGGGGGSTGAPSGSSAGAIAYTGSSMQAKLTAADSPLIFSEFWNVGAGLGATSPSPKAVSSANPQGGDHAFLARRLAKQLSVNATGFTTSRAKKSMSTIPINETTAGTVSGTLHATGSLDDNTGTGSLIMTYANFNDGDGFSYDGAITMQIAGYNMGSGVITDATMNCSLWTIKSQGGDVSLSGSMRLQVNEQNNSEVLTINLDGRDNLDKETFRFQNMVVSSYNGLSISSFTETYTGRLYCEKYGFVDISTASPCSYISTEPNPRSGGPIVLSGAGNSMARVTPVSKSYVKMEVDENGDGVYENKNVHAWNNLAGAAVNVAIAITVTPVNPSIANGTTQQFTATGVFIDNSTQDLTGTVAWSSSNSAIATINSTGLATGTGVGAATITATAGEFSGSIELTVTPAVLVSITISPQNKALLKGTSQQFTAAGTFSDQRIQDITSSVHWDSSDASVATISNAAGSYGRAIAVSNASTVISATSGNISAMTGLTVANWTLQPARLPSYLNSVAWNGAQFVAVGTGPTIYSSPDGVTWNRQISGVTTTSDINDVTWSGTQFVAVGGLMSSTLTAAILTSPDGLSWSEQPSNFLTHLSGVACSNTLCVAAGGNGTILTSPDGKTWTPRDSSAPNAQLADVAWSGSQFVVVGNGAIITSSDGITWTRRADIPINLNGVVWSGSQFVAAGTGIFTSSDGITWTQRDTSYANSISWSGTQYVAVGGNWNNGLILTSPDGVTWVAQTFDSTMILQSVVWGGTRFVAVGAGGLIVTSP